MPIRFNLSYALTKFSSSIPDSKPAEYNEPVICPHCGIRDKGTEGYIGTTKCWNCGLLYMIVREKNNYYANGEKIPKELPF